MKAGAKAKKEQWMLTDRREMMSMGDKRRGGLTHDITDSRLDVGFR
jgi:hypothetical protein